jgi:signal transduction histidine kinase
VAATVGAASLSVANPLGWREMATTAWTWWQGDASGMIIVTPLIVSWRTSGWPRWNVAKTFEATALTLALALATFVIFRGSAKAGTLQLAFVTVPLIIWAAVRFGQREVATGTVIVCLIAIWQTIKGRGPFGLLSHNTSLLLLLAYTSTLVMTGLVLSAVIGQRGRAIAELQKGNEQLGLRVEERTRELELTNQALLTEVAERSRKEEFLRQSEENERQMQRFLAMLSHELRNPLAPIVNALRTMELTPGQDHTKLRTMIQRQVRQLTRIVDDLLDVSRITRGKIELRKELLVLNELIARTVESCQPLIDAREQTMRLDLTREELRVEADPVRISQVVQNLINNAAKFTPNRGLVSVSLLAEDSHAVLRVRDNGRGIPPSLMPRIFEPFVQGDQSLDRSEGGLGIGLMLVKSMVEMHGGQIHAFSAGPDQGSEFVVRLPLVTR